MTCTSWPGPAARLQPKQEGDVATPKKGKGTELLAHDGRLPASTQAGNTKPPSPSKDVVMASASPDKAAATPKPGSTLAMATPKSTPIRSPQLKRLKGGLMGETPKRALFGEPLQDSQAWLLYKASGCTWIMALRWDRVLHIFVTGGGLATATTATSSARGRRRTGYRAYQDSIPGFCRK